MKWEQIESFLVVSEYNSISQAANKLYISQQALSKTIQKLENELGTQLFYRTKQGIQLSPEGIYLKEKFQSLSRQFQKASNETYEHFQVYKGEIEVYVAPGFFRSISAKTLIQFEKQYPNLRVKQLEYPDLECEEFVRQDPKKWGCSTLPWNLQGLTFIPLQREPLYLIVSKENPLSERASVSMSELSDEDFLFLNKKYNIYYRTLNSCRINGYDPHIIYKSADVSQLVRLAALNEGIFICVRHVYEEADNANLALIPIEDEEMFWEIGLIYQDSEQLSANSRLFTNYLWENMKLRK